MPNEYPTVKVAMDQWYEDAEAAYKESALGQAIAGDSNEGPIREAFIQGWVERHTQDIG